MLFDGVILRLWEVPAAEPLARELNSLVRSPLLVGAGHHDYEAALTYRDMMRLRTRGEVSAFDFIPVLVTGMQEDTTLLRSMIRLVRPPGVMAWDSFLQRLTPGFNLTTATSLTELAQIPSGPGKHAFGIIGPDRLLLARWNGTLAGEQVTDPALPAMIRELDITVLHHFVLGQCLGMDAVLQQRLEHLAYARELPEAAGAVQRGECALALVPPALTLDHLRRLMRARLVLPPATTALVPPVPTGFLMHRLDEAPL